MTGTVVVTVVVEVGTIVGTGHVTVLVPQKWPFDASHPLALALCLGLRRAHRLKNNAATDPGKGHAIARPSINTTPKIITTRLPWILN